MWSSQILLHRSVTLAIISEKSASLTSHSHNREETDYNKEGGFLHPLFYSINKGMDFDFRKYDGFVYKDADQPDNTLENIAIRLNKRQHVFFDHFDIWRERKILDIAGNEGRLSFAALHRGAKHSTILEVRKASVDLGQSLFNKHGIEQSRYEFINQSVFDWQPSEKYDTVLCSGFLSHVFDHPSVFAVIRAADPNFFLIDTTISKFRGPLFTYSKSTIMDGCGHETYESFVDEDDLWRNYSICPTRSWIEDLARNFGFMLMKEFDWAEFIKHHGNQGIEDYDAGRKYTAVYMKR